jgi:hypothetical protein
MGSALYITLEREIAGVDTFTNEGKTLAKVSDELEALANQLGVEPLMRFFSVHPDEVAALLEGSGGVDDLDLPDEAWYRAEDGLETVDRLLAYVMEHPGAISASLRVIEGLREFQSVLRRASAEKVRWHLTLDY